jgi:signal transduction histidine kinase
MTTPFSLMRPTPDGPKPVSPLTILATIFGFWLFYAILVTLRAHLIDFPGQDEMAWRRALVTAAGMVITVVLWRGMVPFDRRPLWVRIVLAAIFAVPAAYAIAWVNYYVFYEMDQNMLADLKEVRDSGGPDGFAAQLLEMAMSRYFFLIAWCGMYIALGYAGDVQRAERQAAEFGRAAQLAELRALRYQVNPHFLFNALNSLSALVMADRKAQAESFIMNLASFYRASLAGDVTDDVPLRDELAIQRLYLDIEGTRFSDRLTTEFDIPDALQDRMVPGMILQPLIENAIKHGVSRTSQAVTISVYARSQAGQLELTVCDTAPSATVTGHGSGAGIGLANVRDRLMARYGERASIEVQPAGPRGYCVTLLLPEQDDE